MGALLLPPRLLLRALDDLHAIATAARQLPTIERRMVERYGEIQAEVANAVELAGAMLDVMERGIRVAERIARMGVRLERDASAAIELMRALEDRAGDVLAIGARIDAGTHAMVERAVELEQRADDLARTGTEVAEGLPALQQALQTMEVVRQATQTLAQTAEPLQGAAERLGRIVDRLPGAPRGRQQRPEP